MLSFIAGIIAVAKAIPIVDSWLQLLMKEYFKSQIESMKKENLDAIRQSIDDHDQRYLEKILGSKKAGELSGLPGSVIVDHIPGVSNQDSG